MNTLDLHRKILILLFIYVYLAHPKKIFFCKILVQHSESKIISNKMGIDYTY